MNEYDGHVPGAAMLVLRDGERVLERCYGFADLEAGVRVTPATNFRLASVTKQFTATLIGILAERGALSYDDSIARFLPSLPRAITIRHLLTHTSGLIDYEDLVECRTGFSLSHQISDNDVLQLLAPVDRTYFAPGAEFRYSNTGYVFLGMIVARASGVPYATFLQREIFEPLQMRGSGILPNVTNRAYGYTRENGEWIRRDQSITSATLGDGAIYSSINDLARWDETRLLSRETLALAYGWRTGEHEGRRIRWHSGETVSFRNVIVRFPGERLTLVILTNRDEPMWSAATAIAALGQPLATL
ncbi:MAG TPA: serine hydrolase domain-containing protein [Thermoanaerobaculia bacterium]|nr:serine hydrolase domain-containing protein [Thermoanaerobaculia bacterium]